MDFHRLECCRSHQKLAGQHLPEALLGPRFGPHYYDPEEDEVNLMLTLPLEEEDDEPETRGSVEV